LNGNVNGKEDDETNFVVNRNSRQRPPPDNVNYDDINNDPDVWAPPVPKQSIPRPMKKPAIPRQIRSPPTQEPQAPAKLPNKVLDLMKFI
jgi:hypothetical protein